PATLLVVEPDGQRREREYWNPWTAPAPGAAPASPDATAADWREAIEAALRLAVRRRLVADVPVGVLLSGGLDSSLIVALLAEEGQRGLATFSIGFEGSSDEEGDEFRWSDLVAARFDRDHRQVNAALNPDYRLDDDVSRAFVEQGFAAPGAGTPLRRALRLDTRVMLVEDPVKRVDNMTMAFGLEARVPFLDHELVELA